MDYLILLTFIILSSLIVYFTKEAIKSRAIYKQVQREIEESNKLFTRYEREVKWQ